MPTPVSDKRVVIITATAAEMQNLLAQKAFDAGVVPFVADHVVLSQQNADLYEIIFEQDQTTSP